MNCGRILNGILAITAHLGAEARSPTPKFAGSARHVKTDLEAVAVAVVDLHAGPSGEIVGEPTGKRTLVICDVARLVGGEAVSQR